MFNSTLFQSVIFHPLQLTSQKQQSAVFMHLPGCCFAVLCIQKQTLAWFCLNSPYHCLSCQWEQHAISAGNFALGHGKFRVRQRDLEATISQRCEMPPVSCLAVPCFMSLVTFPKTALNLFLFYLKQLGVV